MGSIPEEYIDMLVQEFAYDPIKLPLTEDPAQVLYNRRTLETIWDMKREALNPFTRQPFDIKNVIPQAELRQQMCQCIVNNGSLDVIPDYTKVLSETDMKNLLDELISDYKRLVNAKIQSENGKPQEQQQQLWKPMLQRFNLLRLYCQYTAENRELFSSIRGYEFLHQVVNEQLFILCRDCYSSCDDAKEVCKEVARVADVIGFKESDLAAVPEDILWAFILILSHLSRRCDHVKIQSMILRVARGMFCDSGNDCKKAVFFSCTVRTALFILGRDNIKDISNEDLYNGMSVLKAAWVKNKIICISLPAFDYVDVVLNVVNICISRFKDLHATAKADRANPISRSATNNRHEEDEEQKSIGMIGIALHRGLCLINSIVTVKSYEVGEEGFFSLSKERLQILHIGGVIIRMVELVLAGNKHLGSSHLQFGIKITATLYKEGGGRRREEVVRIFGDLLGSEIVDEYCGVKPLLEHFMCD